MLWVGACRGHDASHEPAPMSTATDDAMGASMSPRPEFYLGGIQVNEEDQEVWLDALQDRKMNTVSVTDYARQGAWNSDDLTWNEEPHHVLAEIRAANARDIHSVLILRVDLDANLKSNRFLWHGMIMPTDDDALASWFDKYTRFALHWAEIAEREGIEVLMIGSELNALASTQLIDDDSTLLESYFLSEARQAERKKQLLKHHQRVDGRHLPAAERDSFSDLESYIEERIASEQGWAQELAAGDAAPLEAANRRRRLLQGHWQELIRRLREVYGGRLGYAANFDQYQDVGFWSDLDVMGINAYFKLRGRLVPEGRDDELYARLEDGWKQALTDIATFRSQQGLANLPVIFTEMGYTYRANSTLHPWADTGFAVIPAADPQAEPKERLIVWRDQPDNLQERALAVRALFNSHRQLTEPFLEGILYWKLSTIPGHKDIESFLLLIDETSDDPLIDELQRFVDG